MVAGPLMQPCPYKGEGDVDGSVLLEGPFGAAPAADVVTTICDIYLGQAGFKRRSDSVVLSLVPGGSA